MNKVLLKRLNMNWTVSQLIDHIKIEKILEPEYFLDGDSKSIAVIK